MTSLKIRNFYFQRFIEKIKKTKFFISKIFYNSPIYGKLNLEELTHYTEVVLPNLWEDDIEKIKNFLKWKVPNNKKTNDPFFFFFHSFVFTDGGFAFRERAVPQFAKKISISCEKS